MPISEEMVKLRVKIKSLAAEAKIIRHEESKFPSRLQRRYADSTTLPLSNSTPRIKHAIKRGVTRESPVYQSLHYHRKQVVGVAARSAQLAYGMLRGRSYTQLEAKCHTPPIWTDVQANVASFGLLPKAYAEQWIVAWKNGEPRPEMKG